MSHLFRIATVVACLALSGAAFGHAVLERAEPPAGAVVDAAPPEVRLLFSEAVEPAFSRVQVVDQAGRRADAGKAAVDPRNARLLRVALKSGLSPGTYRVTWRVVSVDTHVIQGSYSFVVRP
jgi:methionine-rich copper-binding protein CopC